MQTDGDSYSNYIEDILDGIHSKGLKNQSALLLLNFSKKIPGFANFAFNYTHELFNINFMEIRDFSNCKFINENDLLFRMNISQEYLIDLSVLIYCILRDKATKKSGFMGQIRLVINSNFEKLKNIQSFIINNRMCIFYGLYLDEIFEDEGKFLYGFEFIMKAILDHEKFPGTSHIVIIFFPLFSFNFP